MMEERRRYVRWGVGERKSVVISYRGNKEHAIMLDISAGGMRIISSRPLDIGTSLYGEVEILTAMGPFFIIGRVERVNESSEGWEIAVVFEKVSTIPLKTPWN